MKRILIVDDSKIFQKILIHVLDKHYEIVGTALNGLEAFEKYKDLKPDLVLLDITMPNCNGKECLELIKKFDSTANVIMVSSLGDDATIEECKRLGALTFISKNFIRLDQNNKCEPLLDLVDETMLNIWSEKVA